MSLALELTSWRTAYRQLSDASRRRGVRLRLFIRNTSDPTPTTVFYEDSAAVVGIAFATVGLLLHEVTGSAIPDALASIAIGLLLVFVAVRLAGRDRELLTNQAAPESIAEDFRQVILGTDGIERIDHLDVVVVGPLTWLITAEVAISESVSGDAVIATLEDGRARLQQNPGVIHVYLQPVRTIA